jgi:hypothetical protein
LLGEVAGPKVEWKGRVGAAESGNKVIFKGPDGSFGSIAPVQIWGASWKSGHDTVGDGVSDQGGDGVDSVLG